MPIVFPGAPYLLSALLGVAGMLMVARGVAAVPPAVEARA